MFDIRDHGGHFGGSIKIKGQEKINYPLINTVGNNEPVQILLDTTDEPALSPVPSTYSTNAAFSADGVYMALPLYGSPYLSIYKDIDGVYTALPKPSSTPVNTSNDAKFSPDGNYLAVAIDGAPYHYMYSRSGDVFTKLPNLPSYPSGTGYTVDWSPDSQFVAFCFNTGAQLYIWKVTADGTFTAIPATGTTGLIRGMTFSPDGKHLAVACDGTDRLAIYSITGDTFTKLPAIVGAPTGTTYDTFWSADSSEVYVATGSGILKYNRDGDNFTKQPLEDALNISVEAADFIQDGNVIITGSGGAGAAQKAIRKKGDIYKTIGTVSTISNVKDVVVHPDGERVLLVGVGSPFHKLLRIRRVAANTDALMAPNAYSFGVTTKAGAAGEVIPINQLV